MVVNNTNTNLSRIMLTEVRLSLLYLHLAATFITQIKLFVQELFFLLLGNLFQFVLVDSVFKRPFGRVYSQSFPF